jgi:chromosome segregation ATPase
MQDGKGMESLLMNWHLCSDHKLVALFGGFGGAGCNKPCFLCDWDRTPPGEDDTPCSVEVIQQKSEWAQEFFRPIHEAQAKLKLAKQVVQVAKKSRIGVKPADQAKPDRATQERRHAFQHVGQQLQDNLDHALVQHLCDCQRLQRHAETLPNKHLRAAEAEFEDLRGDLQAAHDRVVRAKGKLQPETASLHQLEEERSQSNEEMDAEEELENLVERIDLAQEAVDAAEESVTGEKDA